MSLTCKSSCYFVELNEINSSYIWIYLAQWKHCVFVVIPNRLEEILIEMQFFLPPFLTFSLSVSLLPLLLLLPTSYLSFLSVPLLLSLLFPLLLPIFLPTFTLSAFLLVPTPPTFTSCFCFLHCFYCFLREDEFMFTVFLFLLIFHVPQPVFWDYDLFINVNISFKMIL